MILELKSWFVWKSWLRYSVCREISIVQNFADHRWIYVTKEKEG